MNKINFKLSSTGLIAAVIGAATLAGCAMTPEYDPALTRMRGSISELQVNQQLAPRAPDEIAAADAAISAAEAAQDNSMTSENYQHLVYVADRKLATAWAAAQDSAAEERVALLGRQRQAELARMETNEQLQQQQLMQQQRLATANAQQQAYAARQQAELAMMETDEYRRQIADLKTRPSERGLVVTLGDVLFATGSARLERGSEKRLDKLVAFLNRYPQHTAVIEGHTDSIGNEAYNMALSKRRAEEVRRYLLNQGIAVERVSAVGRGKSEPVASNQDASGRQQNRRVEVILQSANS